MHIKMDLESESDAESNVAPVEIRGWQNVEFWTDVQGELDWNSFEIVFQTSLSGKANTDTAVAVVTILPGPKS